MAKMTPRENFINFFAGKPYEWIPNSEDRLMFSPDMISENVARGGVRQQEPYQGVFGGRDFFGVEWAYDDSIHGSMETGRLLDEIFEWREKVVFPDLDALDWEGCAAKNSEYLNTDKLVTTVLYSGLFERLISFLGFEGAAIALIDEDEQKEVKALFEKLSDFYIDLIGRLHKYFNVEMIVFHDDWAGQRGPFFSIELLREIILPNIKTIVEGAHREGVLFKMHCCGKVEQFIPDLIDTGADTWRGQNINDKLALVNAYGDRFRFCVELCYGNSRGDTAAAQQIGDDVLLDLVKEFKMDYADKNVWVMFDKDFAPAQKAFMRDALYK